MAGSSCVVPLSQNQPESHRDRGKRRVTNQRKMDRRAVCTITSDPVEGFRSETRVNVRRTERNTEETSSSIRQRRREDVCADVAVRVWTWTQVGSAAASGPREAQGESGVRPGTLGCLPVEKTQRRMMDEGNDGKRWFYSLSTNNYLFLL